METLWNISGTVAYKNGRIEEVGAIKDFGGARKTGTNQAWIDLFKDDLLRSIFHKNPIIDNTVVSRSYRINYTAVGSYGFQEISSNSEISIENIEFLRNSFKNDPLFYQLITASLDGIIENGDLVIGNYENLMSNLKLSIPAQITGGDYLGNNIIFCSVYNSKIIYKSFDMGITWSTQTLNFGQTGNYRVCSCGDGIVLIGTYGNGKILRSTDYGVSWSDIGQLGAETRIYGLDYFGNGVVLATTLTGKIYKSSDSGISWKKVGQLTIPNRLYGTYRVGDIFLAFGYATLGTDIAPVLRSTDNGENWIEVTRLPNGTRILTFCLDFDNNILIANGSHGDITNSGFYRSDDLGLTFQRSFINFDHPLDNYMGLDDIFFLTNLGYVLLLEGTSSGTDDTRYYRRSFDNGFTWEVINAARCNYTSQSLIIKNIGSDRLIYFLGLTPDSSQVLISSVTPLSDYFDQY
jgi:hypothetical protein